MQENSINRLAYLNTLKKKPLDLILEIIEIECYEHDFHELETITSDGRSIQTIIHEKYSIYIEDYILKKWLKTYFHLNDKKIMLKCSQGDLNQKIKKIKKEEEDFLSKVSELRQEFIVFSKNTFNLELTKENAKKIFQNYIYHATHEKNTDACSSNHLYVFQSFLKHLFDEARNKLEMIENFGVANQIQNLVLNSDNDDQQFLQDCVIFLDTPIIMRRLGYDGIDLAETYEQFIEDLKKAGATIKIFDHTFEEVWGILFNFKRCIAQKIFDAKGVDTFLKAKKEFQKREKPELSLEKEDVKASIVSLDIEILDIVQEDKLDEKENYNEWQFDEELLEKKVIEEDQTFEKYKSRLERDVLSISSISRLRNQDKTNNVGNFKDGKFYFLVDNYVLMNAIKAYHQEKKEQFGKNELMFENTIMFNLWQNLTNNDSLNRALFRSKCFALNTIDEKFKDKLYREVRRLEVYKPELKIDEEIINSPELEDEVFEEVIKNEKQDDQNFLSETIQKKVTQRKILERKIIELENDKTAIEKNFAEKYPQQQTENILAIEQALSDCKITIVKKKKQALEDSLWQIIITCIKQLFSKDFNRDKYFWDKACSIVGVSIEYSPSYSETDSK